MFSYLFHSLLAVTGNNKNTCHKHGIEYSPWMAHSSKPKKNRNRKDVDATFYCFLQLFLTLGIGVKWIKNISGI